MAFPPLFFARISQAFSIASHEAPQSLGFELAEKNWLTISIGTASSFSVSLLPHKAPPEIGPEPASLTVLQRLVLAVLRRAKNVAASLRTEHFELARLRLCLAGIGLGIPSVTATLLLRELAVDAQEFAGATVTASDPDGDAQTEAHPSLLERARAAVGSLFKRGDGTPEYVCLCACVHTCLCVRACALV